MGELVGDAGGAAPGQTETKTDQTGAEKTSWIRGFLYESALAFVVSTIMLPAAIAVATVLLYVTSPGTGQWYHALNRTPARVCFFAVVFALLFCALLAVTVCRRFVRAGSACPNPFDEIQQRVAHVRERVSFACSAGAPDPLALRREASEHCDYLGRLVANPRQAGFPWLLATGYLDAWRRLHAVEESLLFLDPVPLVVGEALNDELRLQGSGIPQSAALLKRLRVAVAGLDRAAAQFLVELPPAPPSDGGGGSGPPPADDARAALVQVRSAITEFRDSRREALVRARNRLFATIIFEGITGCILLFIAILSGATSDQVVAAATFYLVGAVVGLVKQLQSAAAADGASQEDYGLGVVRLVQTPLLSGLAAIGGVVLVQLAQSPAAATAATAAAATASFSLSKTFDLGQNPYGLVAAAFFGLTPALLLSSLQQRIDQYKSDLGKSGASSSSESTGSSGT